MGSYVISVSAGTGCYRHIRISENASLLMLHKAIINAFDFNDDHEHAFFLTNRSWSHERAYFSSKLEPSDKLTKSSSLKKAGLKVGDKFKYVFDFGDEWEFQCHVLRTDDEVSDIPYILRSVGKSPEQYPSYDDLDGFDFFDDEDFDDEDDDEEDDDAADNLPEVFSPDIIKKLYAELPLSKDAVHVLQGYFIAVSRIYGIAPVTLVHELYCKYEQPMPLDLFLEYAEVISHDEDVDVYILGKEFFSDVEFSEPADREIVHSLFVGADDDENTINYVRIMQQREGKPMFTPSREELLSYSDRLSIPNTPQAQNAVAFFGRVFGDAKQAKLFVYLLSTIVADDAPMDEVFLLLDELKVKFSRKDLTDFLRLFKDFNNNTRKFANNGFTPIELCQMMKGK